MRGGGRDRIGASVRVSDQRATLVGFVTRFDFCRARSVHAFDALHVRYSRTISSVVRTQIAPSSSIPGSPASANESLSSGVSSTMAAICAAL